MPQLHWEPIASGEGEDIYGWGRKKEGEGKCEKYKEQWGGGQGFKGRGEGRG